MGRQSYAVIALFLEELANADERLNVASASNHHDDDVETRPRDFRPQGRCHALRLRFDAFCLLQILMIVIVFVSMFMRDVQMVSKAFTESLRNVSAVLRLIY